MQRFQEAEATEPLYDSATASRIIERAKEIESSKPEVMSTAQIEALGRELGLSADTIRRAIGKVHHESIVADVAITESQQSLRPLTVREITATPLPGLLLGLLYTIFFIALTRFSFTPDSTKLALPDSVIAGAVGYVLLFGIPIVLAFVSGWQKKDWRISSLAGGFLAAFPILGGYIGTALVSLIMRNYWPEFPDGLIYAGTILLTLIGGFGGWLRRRHDAEQAERERLQNR